MLFQQLLLLLLSYSVWEVVRPRIFSVNCIVCKKKNITEKIQVFYRVQFLRFTAESILRSFKSRSRRARVDQNDMKFVFCMKNLFLGFAIPLRTWVLGRKHINAYRIWKQNKYENQAHLIINNKSHVGK